MWGKVASWDPRNMWHDAIQASESEKPDNLWFFPGSCGIMFCLFLYLLQCDERDTGNSSSHVTLFWKFLELFECCDYYGWFRMTNFLSSYKILKRVNYVLVHVTTLYILIPLKETPKCLHYYINLTVLNNCFILHELPLWTNQSSITGGTSDINSQSTSLTMRIIE